MLKEYFIKAKKKHEVEGTCGLFHFLWKAVGKRVQRFVMGHSADRNPAKRFQVVLDNPEQKSLVPISEKFNPNQMRIHWLIPDFDAGSGGHSTVFKVSEFLQQFGHQNTVWIYGQSKFSQGQSAKFFIQRRFQPYTCDVKLLRDNFDEIKGDLAIATDHWSIYPLRNVTQVRERLYFVQDYEPYFFPHGAEYFLTENTYREGYPVIAAGQWLKGLMESKYSAKASSFDLAYDPKIYYPAETSPRIPGSIAFYGRQFTPRRVVELGFLAFEELHRMGVPFQVEMFGGGPSNIKVPYSIRDHGVLSPTDLAQLYRQCQLGLVFSATNYSLVPHEMMACGLPVVEFEGENTRAIFPDNVISWAQPDPRKLACHLAELLGNPAKLHRQTSSALKYVSDLTWEKSARQVEAAMREFILSG